MAEEQQEKHGEFEREPVPESKTRGLKAFVGMYAGEHCAGTELMIGPLFVAEGKSFRTLYWLHKDLADP